MIKDALAKSATLQLSAGHLLVVWDVLANRACESGLLDSLTVEERRAIWALQDICEQGLAAAGITARHETEWNALMEAARAHVQSVPVEYLDRVTSTEGSGVCQPPVVVRLRRARRPPQGQALRMKFSRS